MPNEFNPFKDRVFTEMHTADNCSCKKDSLMSEEVKFCVRCEKKLGIDEGYVWKPHDDEPIMTERFCNICKVKEELNA